MAEISESKPLLVKEEPYGEYTEDGSLDVHGNQALRKKTGSWKAASFILAFVVFESLAYNGIATNLVMYLSKILHEGNASAASNFTTWNGTGYLTPLLGAFIADSYWGRYKTSLASVLIYLPGLLIVTFSACFSFFKPSICGENSCALMGVIQNLLFFGGLYLVAIGSGTIKASLLPLGADQFEEGNPIEEEQKGSYFNWFYFSMNVGALISSTCLVWIEDNINWALGFGIATFFIALAAGAFMTGTPFYRLRNPCGNPFKKVIQVVVASIRKAKHEAPVDSTLLYEEVHKDLTVPSSRTLTRTDEYRFLDKAAIVSKSDIIVEETGSYSPWRVCTVTQVEELKILLRLAPIWLTGIFYSVAYAQIFTTFIQQGNTMDTNILNFNVDPASLYAFEVTCVMFWVLMYDKVFVFIGKRFTGNPNGMTQLQRMGIGRLLVIFPMTVAALVEWKRLKNVQEGKQMNLAWQLPQYILIAASEVFSYIGQHEFFYSEAPDSLKSLCAALSLLTISLGNYLSSIFVSVIVSLTAVGGSQGWIPDNLNDGHLDYFFWVLAGFSVFSFVYYIIVARRYKPKKVFWTSEAL